MARYFEPLSPPPPIPDPHEELLLSLSRINTFNTPVQTCSTGWTFHGFYAGPTSITLLFYRLSQLYPDLEFKSQSLLDWAQAYLRPRLSLSQSQTTNCRRFPLRNRQRNALSTSFAFTNPRRPQPCSTAMLFFQYHQQLRRRRVK